MKLALGTVQFGLDYGVANQGGQVSLQEASDILALARKHQIDTLDTAIAYGNSENVLGEIGTAQWRVVSKLPEMPENVAVGRWVQEQVEGSLSRLRCEQLYAVMLHRPEQLSGPQGAELADALRALKAQGRVKKIGVSIYQPEELGPILQKLDLDIIQAPLNIIDRRLQSSGWLSKLKAADVEVHVRSAFLQGLLLMDKSQRPQKFERWDTLWETWDAWLAQHGLTPLQACLGFLNVCEGVDRVVVGVDSRQQLTEILNADTCSLPPVPEALSSDDVDLINPAHWNSL